MAFSEYKDGADFKDQCGYTIDEAWYPRVTKIVTIKSKPALYRYYGDAPSFRAAEAATERSAEEGTAIHEAVEGLLLGKKPGVDVGTGGVIFEIPADISPAVSSFLKFFAQNNIHVTPELVERRIVNRDHRYAGTVDAIAVIGGKLGVLDIKTSAAIYRDYCLQTSAYVDALKNEFPTLETRWILRIDQIQLCNLCGSRLRTKGGNEKIKLNWHNRLARACQHEWSAVRGEIELQEFPSWQNDFQAFLGAKRLWEWENEEWLKRVGYLS